MNTPAHLLLGAAVFAGRKDRKLIWAGMAGGLLPDLSLYLMAGVALQVLNIPPRVVFDELYFSDAWQTVFAVDNSVLIWGALAVVAVWSGRGWAIALTTGALLHLALDFPLHHDDGRPHFWPLSDWVFESPISYWDRQRGALWVAPIETGLAICAALWIWKQRPGWAVSLTAIALLAAQLMVARVWMFVFIDG